MSALKYWITWKRAWDWVLGWLHDNHDVEVRSPDDHIQKTRATEAYDRKARPAHPCSRPSHDQMINLHHILTAPHPIRQFWANFEEEFFFFKSQIENYSSSIHVSLQRSSFFQQQSSDNRYLNHSRGDNLLQIFGCFFLVSPNTTPQTPPNVLYSV
jgi:hypothetical protein